MEATQSSGYYAMWKQQTMENNCIIILIGKFTFFRKFRPAEKTLLVLTTHYWYLLSYFYSTAPTWFMAHLILISTFFHSGLDPEQGKEKLLSGRKRLWSRVPQQGRESEKQGCQIVFFVLLTLPVSPFSPDLVSHLNIWDTGGFSCVSEVKKAWKTWRLFNWKLLCELPPVWNTY